MKYYKPAASDLPAPSSCLSPSVAPLFSGLLCSPVCPHSILQDTSPSCPRGVCLPYSVCVCVSVLKEVAHCLASRPFIKACFNLLVSSCESHYSDTRTHSRLPLLRHGLLTLLLSVTVLMGKWGVTVAARLKKNIFFKFFLISRIHFNSLMLRFTDICESRVERRPAGSDSHCVPQHQGCFCFPNN